MTLSKSAQLRQHLRGAYQPGDRAPAGTDNVLARRYGLATSTVRVTRNHLGIQIVHQPYTRRIDLDLDLVAFASFVGCEGVPPTVREFQAARGYASSSVAAYHFDALEEEGLIARRTRGAARTYQLTPAGARRVKTATDKK